MTHEEEFASRPPIPQENLDEMSIFPSYLFFNTIRRGEREYFCSACRTKFRAGERVWKELLSGEEVALWHARHKEIGTCPFCGKNSEIINEKVSASYHFNHSRFVAFFVPVSFNDVWFRCFEFDVNNEPTNEGRGKPFFNELFAYHLQPGRAVMWRRGGLGAFTAFDDYFTQPFEWNSGIYHEKYDFWTKNVSEMTIDDTFLKYSGYQAAAQIAYNVPEIRYLCWAAKLPALEMVAKMGNRQLMLDVLEGNILPSLIDWNAKKPWDFYRLNHQDFNAWCKGKRCGDMDTLRVFRRLKVHGAPGVELAEDILDMMYGNKIENAYNLIARAKRYKVTPKEVVRYLEKQADKTVTMCWHAWMPSRAQFYDTWIDYLEMAKKAGLEKKINPFPKDLKKEHDRMLGIKEQEELKRQEAEMRKHFAEKKRQAAEEAKELEKRFPKIDKICAKIAKKYEYESGDYAIVCPRGIADIILEGKILSHCIARVDRYYERITSGESYLLFLRKAGDKEIPWYTLEVEPGGTVRQKRTTYDQQNEDLKRATDFLREWQAEVQKRMTAEDKEDAKRSAKIREEEFRELRETKTVVRSGILRGKLLADVLEADLMEIEIEETAEETKETKTA